MSPKPPVLPASTLLARRTQLTGSEALAQAQTLWNSGSADAAIEMVGVGHGQPSAMRSGSEAIGNPQLLTLVREWTRCSWPAAVTGGLGRLDPVEPVLAMCPTCWRCAPTPRSASAATRTACSPHLAALQARPDEQRWLLGAAVSLAALGQTTSAAELVDKARTGTHQQEHCRLPAPIRCAAARMRPA